jgi:hypothetical protein
MEDINKDVKQKPNYDKPYFKKESHLRHKRESFHKKKRENSHNLNFDSGKFDIKLASKTAKVKLSDAIDKKASAVVSASKEGDVWNVIVEMIDEEYLPGKNFDSMSDIIGVYDVKLSNKGELLSWTKKNSRRRGNTS